MGWSGIVGEAGGCRGSGVSIAVAIHPTQGYGGQASAEGKLNRFALKWL